VDGVPGRCGQPHWTTSDLGIAVILRRDNRHRPKAGLKLFPIGPKPTAKRRLHQAKPLANVPHRLTTLAAHPGIRHDPRTHPSWTSPSLAGPTFELIGDLHNQPLTNVAQATIVHLEIVAENLGGRKTGYGEELRSF
jgi:hypothetical protein